MENERSRSEVRSFLLEKLASAGVRQIGEIGDVVCDADNDDGDAELEAGDDRTAEEQKLDSKVLLALLEVRSGSSGRRGMLGMLSSSWAKSSSSWVLASGLPRSISPPSCSRRSKPVGL